MADSTQTTQYQTGFAPVIQPYAETLLGQAQAYTDVNQNPYQSYTGDRVAQYSPLQQQSYDYAGQMQAAPQLQDATAMAGQAGLAGLNTQYTFGPSNFDAATAKNMMNPYMQNVVDVQKQQAMRDAAIARQGQQAQAVNAGGFGGGRDAIMRNQGNAELQRGLQGIQATGLNNAYTQAQNQYNTQYGQNAQQQQFGAGLGMQGLGLANQSAANLGALGQTQYGQNMGITGLQNQFGLQQQQQAQNIANTKYEDFTNAQNYPFKQMGFMSDIIRGLPTSTTASTMFQSAPTAIQNIASLGLGAAGISKLMANGGAVRSYANGGAVAFDNGGSVFSPEFKRYAVDHIDPRQLPMAQRNAQARGDFDTNQFAMQEMADDAALRRGIAPALPPGTNVVRAAGGGILAFGDGDLVDSADAPQGESIADLIGGRANPRQVAVAQNEINNLKNTRGQIVTPAQQIEMTGKFYKQAEEQAGPNTGMEEYQKSINDTRAGLSRALEQGQGVALLEAASAVLQPGGTMRGLGAAGAVFGKSYSQAIQADRAEKEHLAKAQFLLADAKRKERMGFTKEAQAMTAAHVKQVQEAEKQELLKNKYVADASVNLAKATKQGGAGAGGKPKPFDILNEAALAFKKDPSDANRQRLEAAQEAAKMVYSGTAGAETKSYADANAAFKGVQYTREWKKHVEENYGKGPQAQLQARKEWIEDFRSGNAPQTKLAPQQTKPAPQQKVIKLD